MMEQREIFRIHGYMLFDHMAHHKIKLAMVTESTDFSQTLNIYMTSMLSASMATWHNWRQKQESLKNIRWK